ncbi:putative membrane protein [Helicobacter pylori Hp H-43]|nr:putative membrane protein [Helicobacter pylori Hp H-43]
MLAVSVFLPTLFVFPVFTDSITNLFFKKQSHLSKLYHGN